MSHSGRQYHEQTRFSILTLLDLLLKQGRRNIQIVIFTDHPDETLARDLVSSIYSAPEELTHFRGRWILCIASNWKGGFPPLFQLRPLDEYLTHYWNHGSELPVVVRRFFQTLPPDLSVEEQAARDGRFRIEDSGLKAIQRAQAGLLRKWRQKLRNSIYKRKIDLRAFWLRQHFSSRPKS